MHRGTFFFSCNFPCAIFKRQSPKLKDNNNQASKEKSYILKKKEEIFSYTWLEKALFRTVHLFKELSKKNVSPRKNGGKNVIKSIIVGC